MESAPCRRWPYRLGFALIGLMLLGLAVALPMAIGSVIEEIVAPPEGDVYTLPIAPGVTAHSIIAVQGDGPVEAGNDGVVTYRSAHLDGVASERVVESGHSVQSHPEAIEEIRRILLEHLDETPPTK